MLFGIVIVLTIHLVYLGESLWTRVSAAQTQRGTLCFSCQREWGVERAGKHSSELRTNGMWPEFLHRRVTGYLLHGRRCSGYRNRPRRAIKRFARARTPWGGP